MSAPISTTTESPAPPSKPSFRSRVRGILVHSLKTATVLSVLLNCLIGGLFLLSGFADTLLDAVVLTAYCFVYGWIVVVALSVPIGLLREFLGRGVYLFFGLATVFTVVSFAALTLGMLDHMREIVALLPPELRFGGGGGLGIHDPISALVLLILLIPLLILYLLAAAAHVLFQGAFWWHLAAIVFRLLVVVFMAIVPPLVIVIRRQRKLRAQSDEDG